MPASRYVMRVIVSKAKRRVVPEDFNRQICKNCPEGDRDIGVSTELVSTDACYNGFSGV